MNISKFTQKSMQAVQDLEKVAYEYGNQEIEEEHLLYALLTQEDSLILKLIEKMEIQKEYFIDTVKKALDARVKVSGGQLQRACICRSMMNRPKLLFADEPTGALNRTSSNEVMDELVKLNNEGTTIVMVTHDAKVAAKCGRVLFIVDGNIKGEYTGLKEITDEKERERSLNNWLLDLGW